MSTNLEEATRISVIKRAPHILRIKRPFWDEMAKRKTIFPGGLGIQEEIEVAESDDLVVNFAEGHSLPGGSKDILGNWKALPGKMEIPIEKQGIAEYMNKPKSDGKLLDVATKIADSAVNGLKIRATKHLFSTAADQEYSNKETIPQGIFSAMNVEATYLQIARTTGTTNAYWQPADQANTTTEYNLNRKLLRTWINKVQLYAQPGSESSIMIILGTTLFERLIEEWEGYYQYGKKDDPGDQGIRKLMLDDVPILEDQFLDTMTTSSTVNAAGTGIGLMGDLSSLTTASVYGGNLASYDGTNVVMVLNMDTWQLNYVPLSQSIGGKTVDSMIQITDFFDQSQVEGGAQKWLARGFMTFNCICKQPNANLVRVNVN